MKPIYKFDNNNYFIGPDLIADDEQLPVNSTETKPENKINPEEGLRDPIKYDASNDTWLGATQEEHDEYHKNDVIDGVDPTQPTQDDVVHANLFKQSLAQATAIKQIQEQLAKEKVAIKFSAANPFAESDMFESLKSWYLMGLLSENDLAQSVVQGVITEAQKEEILGAK